VRRLYDRAKQFGTWDPASIDFGRDTEEWRELSRDERDLLATVVNLFSAGEIAVTKDLLPVAFRAAREGRIDDELFVTAWLWEEGKHADFFRRFMEQVFVDGDREPLAQAGRVLLEDELSAAMDQLMIDSRPAAHAVALTTYCLVVEGLLADLGQRVLEEALEPNDLLPGLRAGLELVNRDESRHIAYGLHVIERLAREDPAVAGAVEARARKLAPLIVTLANSVIDRYETRPFGLSYAIQRPMDRFVGLVQRMRP